MGVIGDNWAATQDCYINTVPSECLGVLSHTKPALVW